MISLARANLIHDWRRHIAAVVVLALAGLLMTTQLGFVGGFVESQGELERQMRADIVILKKDDPVSGSRRGRRSFVETRHEGLIWIHPEVDHVRRYSPGGGGGRWQSDDGPREFVRVTEVDLSERSMTYPRRFPESLREILEIPGMAVTTRTGARRLGAGLGDTGRINAAKVTIGGIVNGLPAWETPVFVSPQTARLISPGEQRGFVAAYLVKLKDPSKTERVIAEFNQLLANARLEAVRPDDYASGRGLAELLTSSFGWILMGSALFGLIVGCGIASQTLRGAFLAQIKEFGSLRALGVSRKRMAAVAMEQAWWTGLASIPLAVLTAHVVRLIALQFDLIIALSNGLVAATSILLLIVALLAGLISLTAVTQVEPAELLR